MSNSHSSLGIYIDFHIYLQKITMSISICICVLLMYVHFGICIYISMYYVYGLDLSACLYAHMST